MAQKAARDVEQFSHVLVADQALPVGDQSVFVFRPLTQGERLRMLEGMEVVLVDRASGTRSIKPCGLSQSYEAVLLTLVDVKNFPAGAADPYPLDKGREACARYLEALDDAAVIALGNYVVDRATLGPPEKNSLTP